jgi:hypothetical protein
VFNLLAEDRRDSAIRQWACPKRPIVIIVPQARD